MTSQTVLALFFQSGKLAKGRSLSHTSSWNISTLHPGMWDLWGLWQVGILEAQSLVVLLLKLCFVQKLVLIELLSWQWQCHENFWELIQLVVDPKHIGIRQYALHKPFIHSLIHSPVPIGVCDGKFYISLARPWYPDICSNIILDVSMKVCFLFFKIIFEKEE